VTPSLHSDSQSAIDLANNAVYYGRTKHIDVQYYFIQIFLKDDVLSLVKIHTSRNFADMLTKIVTPRFPKYMKTESRREPATHIRKENTSRIRAKPKLT